MQTVPIAALLTLAIAALPAPASQLRIDPLVSVKGQTSSPHLSPDGKSLAYEWCTPDYHCGVYIRPLAGGRASLVADGRDRNGIPVNPQWSPDGTRIALTWAQSHYENHLWVYDLATRAVKPVGNLCHWEATAHWTPDGQYLIASVYVTENSGSLACKVTVFSAQTGKRTHDLTSRGEVVGLSPDGRTMIYSDGGTLKLLRLGSGHHAAGTAKHLAREPGQISGITWTADGKQVLYRVWADIPYLRWISIDPPSAPKAVPTWLGYLDVTQFLPDRSALATRTITPVTYWRVNLAKSPFVVERTTALDPFAGPPAFSPDGRSRAFVTTRTGMSQIWIADANGNNERPLLRKIPGFTDPDDASWPKLAGWSPDGNLIAFTIQPRHSHGDTRSHLYVIPAKGGRPYRVGHAAHSLYFPSWTLDSQSLYATRGWSAMDQTHGSASPIVRVRLPDGSLLPTGADGYSPRVSNDGKSLYYLAASDPVLFRLPLTGGAKPEQLYAGARRRELVGVGKRFLYLSDEPPVKRDQQPKSRLIRFDPSSRRAELLVEFAFQLRNVFLSPDEQWLYLEQHGDLLRQAVRVTDLF